ncbi:hypothetical protein A4R43_08420 [Amycolatopsis albispora]|uniref:PEP phosphonomutase n=2 Tax=Amycolatopsis albispora TaxID=1804986 RepID=A0A344LJY6_9PSEU|nr:hypothetical protein A4R43_08420 [Amycolatopsis albispora]
MPANHHRGPIGWLRDHVARFSNGEDHRRRRALVTDLLAGIDPARLNHTTTPVAALADALGIPADPADVAEVARVYHPHLTPDPAAEQALTRLVDACGGTWDEPTAAKICLLVQARAGLAGPVRVTRRQALDGRVVELDLLEAGLPFGAGPHECPGQAHVAALTGFAALHHAETPLLLPNAWDYASAAALHDAGFPAIGTTSLGVAATHGLPDGGGHTRAETVALARSLSRLPCPITVDIEAGFSEDPGEVADLAAELVSIGIAGINLEDSRPGGLAEPDQHAALVKAVKTRAPSLFVNARTDTHWLTSTPPPLSHTLDRARRYVEAGADGIFVPGLTDPADIAAVVGGIPVPINVLYSPGLDYTGLVVGRVSLGSLLYRAALHAATGVARSIRNGEPIPDGIPGYQDVTRLIP